MRARLSGFCLSLVLVSACGGGGMAERDPEGGSGGESAVVEASEAGQPAQSDTPSQPQAVAADAAAYEAEITNAVRQGWTGPARDSRTPPRVAVVTLELGQDGRLEGWSWRRRSAQGMFNDNVAAHLDELVGSSRSLPLPPEGSDLREQVLADGMPVEFADE